MIINIHRVLLSTIILATSFSVAAVEVYEQKDQEGNVEFSDQPTAGAKEIEIDPNVVKVAPVVPIESTPSAVPSKKLRTAGEGVEPEVTHRGVVDDYDDERLRNEHRERDRLNANEQAVQLPAHHEIREEVRHEGGHRR